MGRFLKIAATLPALLLVAGPVLAGGLLGISGSGINVNLPGIANVGVGTGNGGLGVEANILPGAGGGVSANVGAGGNGSGFLGVTTNATVFGNTPSGGVNGNADVCIGNCGINANVGVAALPGSGNGGVDVNAAVCIGYDCNSGAPQPGQPGQPPVSPGTPVYQQLPPQLPPTPRSYTGSSREVIMVDRIIRNQGWSAFLHGQSVCLPVLRIAMVQGWLPGAALRDLQNLATYHSSEIRRLRALLAACPTNRMSAADLSRVLALDIMADGTPVVLIY